jgi:hypothetical protein
MPDPYSDNPSMELPYSAVFFLKDEKIQLIATIFARMASHFLPMRNSGGV